MMDLFSDNYAIFTVGGNRRTVLWRKWDEDKPCVMFIGLNPSTANETTNDPTIRKVMGFAKRWGFGGVYMLNLFTWVSSNPDDLKMNLAPMDLELYFIHHYKKECSHVVFAWGNFKIAQIRGREIAKQFPDALALVKNQNGSPRHPLYIPYDTQVIKFSDGTPFEFNLAQ